MKEGSRHTLSTRKVIRMYKTEGKDAVELYKEHQSKVSGYRNVIPGQQVVAKVPTPVSKNGG
jgi:hypothetical protein